MSELYRFGVSLSKKLIEKFDAYISGKKYSNRSEAIRDLIRNELVKKEWETNEEVAGALTIIYNHHKRELLHKVTNIQHDYLNIIISTQHIHLDHDNCLEIIAVKGIGQEVKKLYDNLHCIKGIIHSTLNMSSTGKKIE